MTSPRPWRVEYGDGYDDHGNTIQVPYQIVDANGERVVETDTGVYPPTAEDAELIVRAVNAGADSPTIALARIIAAAGHPDPVEACRLVIAIAQEVRRITTPVPHVDAASRSALDAGEPRREGVGTTDGSTTPPGGMWSGGPGMPYGT